MVEQLVGTLAEVPKQYMRLALDNRLGRRKGGSVEMLVEEAPMFPPPRAIGHRRKQPVEPNATRSPSFQRKPERIKEDIQVIDHRPHWPGGVDRASLLKEIVDRFGGI